MFELEVGIAKSTRPEKRTRQLKGMLALILVLPFGIEEARSAALIRTGLERQGSPIGPYDTLIAATAMVRGAILVTRNTREFKRTQGLRLQDGFGSDCVSYLQKKRSRCDLSASNAHREWTEKTTMRSTFPADTVIFDPADFCGRVLVFGGKFLV